MKHQIPFVRPPHIAVWLVDFFTPNEQSESIPGDLLEEFTELASTAGVAFARRWYWRQSVRTIAHLIATGFLVKPWMIVGTVVGGWLLGWTVYLLTEKTVVAILHKYQVYAHINAYLFWLLYGVIIERLIQPLFEGSIVATAAKGREMVATMTLSFVIFAVNGAALVQLRHYWSMANFQLMPLIVTTFVSPLMVVIGGGIVRKIRSDRSRRYSATHC